MATLTADPDYRQSMLSLLKGSLIDRVILSVSLLAIAVTWLFIQLYILAGPVVAEIYHGQRLLATYPMPQAGESPIHFEVEGDLGRSEIVLDSDGVRMNVAPCSSQRCVQAGNHKHSGDMIACVPNRVLVLIRGKSDLALDAVVE